jgi:LEA14-like dessication related protein
MKGIRALTVIILLAAAGIICYIVLTNKAAPEFVSVGKISVGNVQLTPSPAFDLSAELEFNNPNSFGLTIKEVECAVFISGDKVTTIKTNKDIDVPASAHFFIPVASTIKLSEQDYKKIFGTNLFESLLNNEIKMKFEGEMTLSKFGLNRKVPFSYDYNYKIL